MVKIQGAMGDFNVQIPKTAVVLSGGAGMRLRPLTDEIPKGLVKVAGKPLLEWVVDWLRDSGVTDLVIGVAYLKEKIIQYFGDGSKFGVEIRYSTHTVDGGTGEGFRLAISRHVTSDCFFALNGDQITNLSLRSMFNSHRASRALATIGVVHPRLPFGLVLTDRLGFCTGFVEKPAMKDVSCSSGIYVFDKGIKGSLPRKGDVEKVTFPRLARQRRVKAYIHNGSFLTVNSLRELEEAEKELGGVRRK